MYFIVAVFFPFGTGAAIGPMLTGLVRQKLGWSAVFDMLMISAAISAAVSTS